MRLNNKYDIIKNFNCQATPEELCALLSSAPIDPAHDKYYLNQLYDRIYYSPSGQSICELQLDENPNNDTLLMISKQLDHSLSSYSISYDDLVSEVADMIIRKMKLGSMAYEDIQDYSLENHDHDYLYNGLSVSSPQENNIRIAQIKTADNQTYDIFSKQITYNGNTPYVGQIKMLYRKSKMDQIDINSDDFDGWVYPDGREYDTSKFPKLYNILGSNRLPNLDNLFIKLSNEKTDSVIINDQHIGLISHKHSQAQKINANLSVNTIINDDFKGIKLCNTNSSNNPTEIHTGGGKQYPSSVTGLMNINGVKFDISCSNSGNEDEEYYPTHFKLPVMMYIGKPQS